MDLGNIAAQGVAVLLGAVGGGLLGGIVGWIVALRAERAGAIRLTTMQGQLTATQGQLTALNAQLETMREQLKVALETSTRSSHLDLLRLVIHEKDLWEVWNSSGQDESTFKRGVFINLHLSHVETLFELGRLTEAQVAAELSEHFRNSHYRTFWDMARSHRQAMLSGATSKARSFHDLCEKAYSSAGA